mmetsp:Transcript_14839/g.37754  ORF Transcript_14839/g.37754 Transcript_14839/m.37754 type:complete len:93 (-) Transcript_14839:108-386(-)
MMTFPVLLGGRPRAGRSDLMPKCNKSALRSAAATEKRRKKGGGEEHAEPPDDSQSNDRPNDEPVRSPPPPHAGSLAPLARSDLSVRQSAGRG